MISYEDLKSELLTAVEKHEERGFNFDVVREVEGKTSEEWPNGFIHQAALDSGYNIIVEV